MSRAILLLASVLFFPYMSSRASENWCQYGFDSRHSGNAPRMKLSTPLELQAAIPLTDSVFTSPIIYDVHIFVLDGSGVLFCIDARTFEVVWQFVSDNSPYNCNNYCSPAIVNNYGHFGTDDGHLLWPGRCRRECCPEDRVRRTDICLPGRGRRLCLFCDSWFSRLQTVSGRQDPVDLGYYVRESTQVCWVTGLERI